MGKHSDFARILTKLATASRCARIVTDVLTERNLSCARKMEEAEADLKRVIH